MLQRFATNGAVLLLDRAPEYFFVGDIAHVRVYSGGDSFEMAQPPNVLLLGIQAAEMAYADWESGRKPPARLPKKR